MKQKSQSFIHPLMEKLNFYSHFKGTNWKEYIKQYYDVLAPYYDKGNDIFWRGNKTKLIRQALSHIAIRDDSMILDACTGTGDIALTIAAEHPTVSIIGIDNSKNMLKAAKIKTLSFPNIQYKLTDVYSLPFEKNTFDYVFVGFGLSRLDNIEMALQELQRVITPGGIISIIEAGTPTTFLRSLLRTLYCKSIELTAGAVLFYKSFINYYTFQLQLLQHQPSPHTITRMLTSIGCREVNTHSYQGGIMIEHIAKM